MLEPDGDAIPATVAVFGDQNLNLLDGSSVWLVSLCAVLDRLDVRGHLILKADIERDVLARELERLERFRVWRPDDLGTQAPLNPRSLPPAVEQLDAEVGPDVVIVRGFDAAGRLAATGDFSGRLWPYLTDIPQSVDAMTPEAAARLEQILEASGRVLCQTESLRSFLVRFFPEFDRKTILIPPMVADDAFGRRTRVWGDGGLRLFYGGKFAPLWGIEEMYEYLRIVRQTHPDVSLTAAGDKIHRPVDDSGYADRVERGLEGEGVNWIGGVDRDQLFATLGQVDLALSVRNVAVNESREVSTKLLEYAAARLPAVVNRTLAHEELLGSDYPLFVDRFEDVPDLIEKIADDPQTLAPISRNLERVAARHSYAATAEALRPVVAAAARPSVDLRGRHIVVAGHDLKFATLLIDALRSAGAEVVVDPWTGHATHDGRRSRELLSWADDVICEWCLGNAAWYSEHKTSDQRLWVRFHRAELESPWPERVVLDAVDGVGFVADHVRDQAARRFGWSRDRLGVVPNLVDLIAFDRPKLPGARFTLGMLGWLPRLKRLDLALDILERVRAQDARFRLEVKGRLPWEMAWVWDSNEERDYYEQQFARMRSSPLLGNSVTLSAHAGDVPSWFRKIGSLLSTSDIEGSQVALVEGMASGAVPVALRRAGIESSVSARWVSASAGEAAEAILDGVADWPAASRAASSEANERNPSSSVRDSWLQMIESGTLPGVPAKHRPT